MNPLMDTINGYNCMKLVLLKNLPVDTASMKTVASLLATDGPTVWSTTSVRSKNKRVH